MARVIARFVKDEDGYINIPAEEFHEDGDFIKVYSEHQELVGMFRPEDIRIIYRSGEC
jgi:hypothetical protein